MATPIKWGNEFLVNTITTGGQVDPVIIGLANGRFLVTWTDRSETLGPGSESEVRGQIFNADGTRAGTEFLVNSFTSGFQITPAAVALPNGGFIVTWLTDTVNQISAQIFNADGSKSGGEIKVPFGASDPIEPSITLLENGRFVVAWQEHDGSGVWAQMFNANGTHFGSKFEVNTAATGTQSVPTITALQNGGFIATWKQSDGSDGVTHAQAFNSTGTKVGAEFQVTSQIDGEELQQTIAVLANGSYVVAWQDAGIGSREIHARMFQEDGTALGATFTIGANQPGLNFNPAITGLPDGRFMVTWQHQRLNNDYDVQGQLFNADGSPAGDVFTVNTTTFNWQTDPSITVLADGRIVVAWEDSNNALGDTSINGIAAQIFDPRESGVILTGTTVNDDLIGTDFNDIMKGAGGADNLSALGGDDLLIGGAGADTLSGGAGSDTASYVDSSAGVTVNLATNVNTGGEAQGDILYSIQNLIGSDFADTLTGNGLDNVLEGGAGADVLIGGGGIDTASYRTSTTWVNANLHTGLGSHGDAQGDSLSSTIENLIGSDHGDLLTGNAGANTIEGGLGNDGIHGQGGDDTAVFSHNFNDYTLMDYGTKIYVWGPDGYDTVTGIEHLKFADVTITPADLANDGNPLFDSLYYLSRNPDVFQAGIDPLSHFNAVGWQEGRDPNWWFDLSDYLAVNKDVAASGMNPLDHYHQIGWHEGRDPSASFDTTLYLINNPDVAAAGIDPLAHFLQTGLSEGRNSYDAIGQNISGGFDAQYYLFHNPDVAAAGIDPLFHFNAVGWQEGRDPNAWFDTAGYLSHYSDVAAAGINPLQHYEAVGWKEGRDPSAHFDTTGYLAENPDVAAAGINPLDHFLQNGIYEGRQAVNDGMWS
jgi:Ca2+-binding RTX toxin-like protein